MKRDPVLETVRNCRKTLQRTSYEKYRTIVYHLCQDHDNLVYPRTIASLLREGRIDELLDFADSLSSQKYDDAMHHFIANQFSLLIRKYPFPPGSHSHDPEKKAIEKFEAAERKCARRNRLFIRRRSHRGKPFKYGREIESMKNFVAYVLGHEVPLAHIYEHCEFGPGASIGVHGDATSRARKLLCSEWSVSPGALHYAFAAVTSHAQLRELLLPEHAGFSSGHLPMEPEWAALLRKCKYVDHNNIEFVPKTTKTHRSIAVEPLLNGYLQKGTDTVMRCFLKRIGIDLSLQEPNARMAREGSLDGEASFVTIDLSSASDSIAVEVVRDLLPPEWFAFLNAIRSRNFNYRGVVRRFEKFCSMGNGFCFPLETLLFVAACHAVGAGRPGKDFRVYGDDIIVRKPFAEPLIRLLAYLGFSTNRDKTFLEGPFRESCGSDWFGGEDVRPYTFDFALDSLEALFKALNLMQRNPRTAGFFQSVRPLLVRWVPSSVRFFRPYPGPEDTAITSVGDEHLYSPHCRYLGGCWRWRELIHKPIQDRFWRRMGARGLLALVYGALSGSASTCPFTYRRKTMTRVRLIAHPGATSTWLPPTPVLVN